jgi:hypothetical protein
MADVSNVTADLGGSDEQNFTSELVEKCKICWKILVLRHYCTTELHRKV